MPIKYNPQTSAEFRRGLKRIQKRGLSDKLLRDVVNRLANGETLTVLPWRDHPLKGDQKGHRECHISDDWVLIYRIDQREKILYLAGTGTHEDLKLQKPRKH